MRPSIALIYFAIAVIAGSAGAVLFRLTPLPLEMAIVFGACLFFALATLDQAVSRGMDRKAFQRQLELHDHAVQDAFNEIDMIRSRLVSLETDTQQMVDAGVAPIHQDLQAVGALLSQVTETVADADHRLVTLEDAASRAFIASKITAKDNPSTEMQAEDKPKASKNGKPAAKEQAAPQATPQAAPNDTREAERSQALLKRVRAAVKGDRFEVALQSIVTLPQRRARGYALIANLKLDGAGKLEARHAVPAAEAVDAIADYDMAVVLRAVTLGQRFSTRESSSIVYAPINGAALLQSSFASWLVETLGANKDLAGRLVLELPQRDVREFSPLDFDVLGQLYDLGFRMCVSQLTDARSDLFDLARHGFRYAKAPAALFLTGDEGASSDIHPEDLSDLAARNGMDLIVDQVESEAQLVELLDCKLKYGQGNVFSRPRVVEVERWEPVVAESADPEPQPQDAADAEPTASQKPKRPARALSRTA